MNKNIERYEQVNVLFPHAQSSIRCMNQVNVSFERSTIALGYVNTINLKWYKMKCKMNYINLLLSSSELSESIWSHRMCLSTVDPCLWLSVCIFNNNSLIHLSIELNCICLRINILNLVVSLYNVMNSTEVWVKLFNKLNLLFVHLLSIHN